MVIFMGYITCITNCCMKLDDIPTWSIFISFFLHPFSIRRSKGQGGCVHCPELHPISGVFFRILILHFFVTQQWNIPGLVNVYSLRTGKSRYIFHGKSTISMDIFNSYVCLPEGYHRLIDNPIFSQ